MALQLVTSSWKWAADLTAATTATGQQPAPTDPTTTDPPGGGQLLAAAPPPPPTLDPLCCAAEIHGQLESLQRACRGSAAAAGGSAGDHPTALLGGLPFLVVLGRQSAGKSTVLNRLLGLPLLPSDVGLATRVPCEMRCHRGRHPQHGDERVEFGRHDAAQGGRWVVDQSVVLDAPADAVGGGHQQPAWVAAVHRALAQATRDRAGPGHQISAHALVVRVYSHRVPNLALIDLPGFTAVAKSSQAADLPQQLEQLALSYVRRPQALLVVVVTARVDFEAHDVLQFLRERDCDPTGERTIGLITKCDTLHDGDVGAYLRGDADPNLLLPGGGYWALCTPPPPPPAGGRGGAGGQSVDEREAAYFASHPVYGGGACAARCGVAPVRAALLALLTRRVRAELPAFRQRLLVCAEATAQRSRELGAVAPGTAAEALATLVRWLHEWADQYTVALYGGGGGSGSHGSSGGELPPPPFTVADSSSPPPTGASGPPPTVGNVGRHLKRLWLDYARTVGELQPFRDATVCSDEYVHELLLDCEGLHLSSRRQPPLLLIERLLTSPTQRPLEWLRAPSVDCLHAVLALLRRTVDATFRGGGGAGTPLARCPLLCRQVAALLDERFAHWHRVGAALIEQLLRAQHFIFQVEPLDDRHWGGTTTTTPPGAAAAADDNSQATTAQRVRALAAHYYAANPVRDFQSCLPRLLMSELVDDTQRYLRNDLLLALHDAQPGADLVHLLQPDERVAVERRELDATARVLASVQALVRTLATQ
jgi:GTP-binding protein EngB required for normal cell division